MNTLVSAPRRTPLTLVFAGGLGLAELSYALAPGYRRESVAAWASTNVTNLTHEPLGPMLASPFVVEEHAAMWFVLAVVAAAMIERRAGWWRALVILGTSHVAGTLVSEGIQWWRVRHGALPASALGIDDVGVSYVAVGLLCAVLICGRWTARLGVLAVFAVLVRSLLLGIGHLDVTAVGHLSAAIAGCMGGMWVRRGASLPGGAPEAGAGTGHIRRGRIRWFRSTRTFSQQ